MPWTTPTTRTGSFSIQFSSILIDQAHEPNNAAIKGDHAVGLTDMPTALRQCCRTRDCQDSRRDFQDEPDLRNTPPDTWHHVQSASVQSAFVKDVQSIVNVMEDFGNAFEEESQDLLVLYTKEIAPSAAVDTLRRAHEVGQLHFDNFA